MRMYCRHTLLSEEVKIKSGKKTLAHYHNWDELGMWKPEHRNLYQDCYYKVKFELNDEGGNREYDVVVYFINSGLKKPPVIKEGDAVIFRNYMAFLWYVDAMSDIKNNHKHQG